MGTDGDSGVGGVRQASLRAHNLALVVGLVVSATEPLTRTDIAGLTGLTRPTVTRIVDHLITARMVAELPPRNRSRAGRPAVPIVAAPRTYVAIGLEVNADYLAARMVDLTGRALAENVIEDDLRNSDAQRVLRRLGAMTNDLARQAVASGLILVGVGCAIPGVITEHSGRLLFAPQLGWRDISPESLLGLAGAAAEVPLHLGNEASLAAESELVSRGRAHRNGRSFLFVYGHGGVGAAMVQDGKVVQGDHGWSGELGHVTYLPQGPICDCGARGCLEQYAGKDAIMRSAGLPPTGPMGQLYAALHRREPAALEALSQAAVSLGVGLAAFINLVDVHEIVLGGQFIGLLPHMRDVLQRELDLRVMTARWLPVTISPALSTERDAANGAAWRVLNELVATPARWHPAAGGQRRAYVDIDDTPEVCID